MGNPGVFEVDLRRLAIRVSETSFHRDFLRLAVHDLPNEDFRSFGNFGSLSLET